MLATLVNRLALAAVMLALPALAAAAGPALVVKPLAERKVADLPPGDLFWSIESFPSRGEAEAAAGSWSLVAESAGRIWLFTLGAAGKNTPGARKVGEVGPIPRISAPQYLLRINEATGAPGSTTPVHTHPGSEAFFVLDGQQTIRGPQGTLRVDSGHAEAGQGAGSPMQVSSTGTTDLHALVMFVVDATRPFSSPATLP